MKRDVMSIRPDHHAQGIAVKPLVPREATIRGFRLELQQVEAAVRECPGVTAAAVVAVTADGRDPRLACYVTPAATDRADLRRRLQLLLPDYMVPSAIVAVDDLPRLPGGEVDADALPAPDWQDPVVGFESPANAREEQIAQVWRSLLGVDEIGRADDFFELGGNSAMAVQMVALLRRAGLVTDVATIFEKPRLAELAAAIGGEAGAAGDAGQASAEESHQTSSQASSQASSEASSEALPEALPASTVAAPRFEDLVQLLSRSAVTRPNALALLQGDARITYLDLDRQANRLANELVARGIRRGDLVGLCLDRTPRMLAAVLAVLKAGAAYVPLDPSYPRDRLLVMAEDAQVALLVAETATAKELGWEPSKTLLLDREWAAIEARPDTVPASEATGDDPAYVIYTSGSTGKPKGVVVHRAGVVNFLASMLVEPGLSPDDRILAVTTLSFDISVLELMLPLVSGNPIVLATREQAYDPIALRELIESSGVRAIQATPATWRLLIDAGWQGGPGIKAMTGGEALRPDLAIELMARTGELWNLYGPTEATVWATCWKVQSPEKGIFVGRAIANTILTIRDEQGRVLPDGEEGEICIGGDGVTTGYLNRPELTAERFVLDPAAQANGASAASGAAQVQGARYYRTGDLGRLLPDGLLQHLGRMDFQVKVRGFRIELGEIEACLASHPQAGSPVAITIEPKPGDVRIVAFFVARGEGQPNVAELRAHLAAQLPEYMVPQRFISIDAVPLMPNGKVDRKKLAEIALADKSAPVATAEYEAPQGELEQALAKVWSEVLGVERVGRNEDFVALGGHSLLALRLISGIKRATGLTLPLTAMLAAPTVRAQAALLSGDAPDVAPTGFAVPVSTTGSQPPIFLVNGYGGTVVPFKALAKELGPDQPLYIVDTALDQARYPGVKSMEDLAAVMLAELRQIQPQGPYRLCGYSLGGDVAWEIARQIEASGDSLGMLVLLDCDAPGHPKPPSTAVQVGRALQRSVRAIGRGPGFIVERLGVRWRMAMDKLLDRPPELELLQDEALGDAGRELAEAAAATFKLSFSYRMKPLRSQVHLIRALLSRPAPGTSNQDLDHGWGRFAGGGVSILEMESIHEDMCRPKFAPVLAERLRTCVAEGEGTARGG